MVGDTFEIYDVKITGKCIFESKNWKKKFLLMPPGKTRASSYHHLKIIYSHLAILFWKSVFPKQKEGGVSL